MFYLVHEIKEPSFDGWTSLDRHDVASTRNMTGGFLHRDCSVIHYLWPNMDCRYTSFL